jgi:hypothetical protein
MKRLALYIILFYIVIILYFGQDLISKFSNSENDRTVIFFKEAIKNSPKYFKANNLNFIPNISYKGSSIKIRDTTMSCFNQAGYRGDIVPLQKDRDKLRILFLGGSTTFSEGGSSIESTFPELVKSELINTYNFNKTDIEIINGALDGANSFDILSFYL